MQANLRLLNADHRRGFGMAEDHKQAEVTQASVGESCCRHGVPQAFFMKKYLN